jgi:hypothetical protein
MSIALGSICAGPGYEHWLHRSSREPTGIFDLGEPDGADPPARGDLRPGRTSDLHQKG